MKKKKKRNTVRKDEKPCFKLVVHLSRNSFGNLKLEIGTRMQSAAMRTDSERRSALEGQCTDILLFCYHIILFQATTRDVGRRRRQRRARTAAEAAENKQTLLREKRLNMFYINLKCCRPAISVLYLPLKIDAPVCSISDVCLPACLFCSSAPQLNVSVPILLITQVCLWWLSRGFKHRKNYVLWKAPWAANWLRPAAAVSQCQRKKHVQVLCLEEIYWISTRDSNNTNTMSRLIEFSATTTTALAPI